MPAGNFVFNQYLAGWLAPVVVPSLDRIGTWDFGAGLADPAGLNDFRLLLVGGGGALNGLDAATSCDAGHLIDLPNLEVYQFNGDGYVPRGFILENRTIAQDNANDIGVASVALAPFVDLGALGAGKILGPNIGDTISDLVLYWTNNSTTLGDGIPIARYDLGAIYRAHGSPLTITADATFGLLSVA
jgi:hypothetical protein